MNNSKVDNRAFSKLLMDWNDPVKHAEEHELLRIVAEKSTEPEGLAAWANIVYAMTGQFDKVTADILIDHRPLAIMVGWRQDL